MRYRYRLLALVCLFCAQPVMAGGGSSLPFAEDEAMPVVLSATRLRQSLLEAPAAVTIIDRQLIEQSGVREIPELLRLVPGMVVAYENGGEAFVSHHGTAADQARRMQVLIDGRSVYQPLLASVDWIGVPLALADIERIEVIRGPNAAAYGLNSFFGVINIITRHPADVARARISYQRGEDGVEDYFARLAQRSGPVDWRLSLSGRRDRGHDTNLSDGTEYEDDKNVDSVYGRALWDLGQNSSFELSFGDGRLRAEQQYRRKDIYTAVPVAERDNRFVSLAWEQELSAAHRLRLVAARSHFDRDEPWYVSLPPLAFRSELRQLYEQNRRCANAVASGASTGCTPADMPLLAAVAALAAQPEMTTPLSLLADNQVRERRDEIEIQHTWVATPAFRTVVGAVYDRARADSRTYLGGRAKNDVWGVFGHAEWRLQPSLLLNVGGSLEDDAHAGTYRSPRLALNWSLADNHVLRAVYSRAVRTPDLLETDADWRYAVTARDPADAALVAAPHNIFYQTGRADGDAPTERITSREMGYHGILAPARLTLDLRLFSDRMQLTSHDLEIDNFVISRLRPIPLDGLELAVDWRPMPSQRLQLNYAYLDVDGPPTGEANTDFVPLHSGTVGWWQSYENGWQWGTTYAFYNDLRDSQFFFDRLDTRLARRISLSARQQLELSAVMQWRLSDDPELRRENGNHRHRGWLGVDWRY